MQMLEIDNLTKRYGPKTVVESLSFRSGAGEVLGFLGPNGAGKSTTMKMVTGFVTPSAGTASVCGHDVETDGLAARRRIGYLPEGAPCYAEMTPASFLSFVADVRGLTGDARTRQVGEAVERLHLQPVLQQSIDTLSKGFKRRVGLAQAILHDPDVLILDEPTDGLDPNQKHEVRELIRSMSADKLIVISTHILEEVDAVCSRAIIISDGQILADASPSELAKQSPYFNAVRIVVDDDVNLAKLDNDIAGIATVGRTECDRRAREIVALPAAADDGAQAWRDVSAMVRAKDIPVSSMMLDTGNLNDVFRNITRQASQTEPAS